MIDKYFSWIDGWCRYNAFYVQVENFNYYTWMYHPAFTAPFMMICLVLFVWAFITFIGKKNDWLYISGAMLLYFVLPPVLSALMYCWEIVLFLGVLTLLYYLITFNHKYGAITLTEKYKNKLSI